MARSLSIVRICAEVGGSGRPDGSAGPDVTVISSLSGTEPWRPRVLGDGPGGFTRVALVATRATLLQSDDVSLEVQVGPGAALEVVEIGATLAHAMRAGGHARVAVSASIADRGRLIWLGEPLIVARDASVCSTLSLELAGTARALRGESFVFGRAGEECGALSSRTRITCDGQALLDETLQTADRPTLRSPVVAGPSAMIIALTLAGQRDLQAPPAVMQAHGPASLWRLAGATIDVESQTAPIVERWRALIAA